MKSSHLFIITCSDHKEAGGKARYARQASIADFLKRSEYDFLIDLRRESLLHIYAGGFTQQGKEIIKLPYNREICEGPDFGARENGFYLAACNRYIGRLYKEISEDAWVKRDGCVLILSGLYGLVTPEELIQRYSLHIKDSRIIFDMWRPLLTRFLNAVIKARSIQVVVDLTGEKAYRELIDWDSLRKNAEVYHVFGSQHAGPSLLEAIGNFLGQRGLFLETAALKDLLKNKKKCETRYKVLHFCSDLNEPRELGLPEEDEGIISEKDNKLVPPQEGTGN